MGKVTYEKAYTGTTKIEQPASKPVQKMQVKFVVENFSVEERRTFCDRINQFEEVD